MVERVIAGSSRTHPADAVLRRELKTRRGVSPVDAADTSRLVFSYYRWQRWLDKNQPLTAQVLEAKRLAEQFAIRPESFSDADLTAKVLPDWIHSELRLTPALAKALQTEPQLWLRARPGQGRAVARSLGHCRAAGQGALSDTLAYRGRQDLFQSAAFQAGAFEIQDISSQVVGLLCAPQPGQTWWDACAGEGGKLLHLADLMSNQGLIWATDRSDWRLRRLKRRAARAKVFNYRVASWDGNPKLPTRTRFDGILIDAPCTGTGTWQRNPHGRWTLKPHDINELAEIQLGLLLNAAPALKSGGKLVYSVCSLTQSETIGVVEAFNAKASGFSALAMINPLNEETDPIETLWFFPQEVRGNGMFVAAWERR
jgi:16S rRNA (cytosine967-C5)-methyltransferase